MKQEEEIKAEAIMNQEEIEEKQWEILQEQILTEKVNICVRELNAHHPKCTQCKIADVCPGFQKDDIDPSVCRHCLHQQKKHSVLYRENDNRLALDYMLQLLQRLQIQVDFSPAEEMSVE